MSNSPSYAVQLIDRHTLISDQLSAAQMLVLLQELEALLRKDAVGDIVEFGCYVGTASLFIRRLLDCYNATQRNILHAYDSFQGLPPKRQQDESGAGLDFIGGSLLATKKQLLQQFHKAHLQPPVIHKDWFSHLPTTAIPNKIMFAFLDGDFYESILTSLQLVVPRLSAGATIVIDDYDREALPGVTKAVHDYFNGRLPRLRVEQQLAIIRYPFGS